MDHTPTETGASVTPESSSIAAALQRMSYGEQFISNVGKWKISNLNSPRMIDLFFDEGKAIFAFQLDSDVDRIGFTNYHREAVSGTGSLVLSLLEEALTVLANVSGKKIAIRFPVFGQDDARHWLVKNGYVQDKDAKDEIFRKELK